MCTEIRGENSLITPRGILFIALTDLLRCGNEWTVAGKLFYNW